MRAWWIPLLLIACGDAGRSKDCDDLAAMVKPDMPRRYYEYSDLGTHDWQNPDVRAAVKKFLSPTERHPLGGADTGWTLYAPYTVAPRNDPFADEFSYRKQRGRFAALHAVCPAISND